MFKQIDNKSITVNKTFLLAIYLFSEYLVNVTYLYMS